jgi:cytochrome c oxidase subunit 2
MGGNARCALRWREWSACDHARRLLCASTLHSKTVERTRSLVRAARAIASALTIFVLTSRISFADPKIPYPVPNIFRPDSTPADSILRLSILVLVICAVIFVIVFCLLVYSVTKYRERDANKGSEPPQVYGSDQVELAWTVIPVLIVIVLVLASARFTHSIQDAPRPSGAVDVIAIGHQFWWEYRYPKFGVVAANELHVPVSDPGHPTPTFLTLLSADTDHSFWVPQLAGKTDLIPNRVNHTWIDPHETGIFLGQCAQYCGVQHAKMLLRVYVDSQEDFERWIAQQAQPAEAGKLAASDDPPAAGDVDRGRQIFESTACINCHAVAGTVADGRFGPDLTHLMSRDTIASGAALNNRENLRNWIHNPDSIKPGSLMPPMQLNEQDLDALTSYLMTLR